MKRILILLAFTFGIVSFGYSQTCNGSLSVTIQGTGTNLPFSTTEAHTDLSCNPTSGAPDGTITLSPVGGTLPYNFDWDDGNSDQDRIGLTAGSYTVTVTDANDCEVILGPIVLTEPVAVSATSTIVQPSCNASSGIANDGSISIVPSGGTGTYSYTWFSADGTGFAAGDEDQSGLTAGTYDLTITDNKGCTYTESFVLNEAVAVSCNATSPVVGAGGTNILCSGGTGTIAVTGAGGSGSYEYQLDSGAFQSSGAFADVSAGAHTITVKDDKGCESTCIITLTEPDPLVAGSCNYVQDLCQLGSGEIKIEAAGGVAPYSVSWTAVAVGPNSTAGNLDQPSPQAIATDGGSVTFTGADGNNQYNFIVTDANGCQVP